MNKRHLLYTIYALSCISKLTPEEYTRIEKLLKNLPLKVFFKLMDGIFYHKSQYVIVKAFLDWNNYSEEKELNYRANELAMWSRKWSRRYN
jgi:hypothetical protein